MFGSAEGEAEVTQEESTEHAGTVLLADDDPDLRALIAQVLRHAGYDVLATRDGGELLRVIESMRNGERPRCDVIVSDVQMPGVTGLEALERIQESDFRVPVIIITAFSEPEVSSKAKMLGAAALLNKPLTIRELRTTVDRVTRGAH